MPGGRRPPTPWIAGVLSLLYPGLGHIYVGMPRVGVAIWVGVWVASGLALWLGSRLTGGVVLAPLVVAALGGTLGVTAHSWRAARRHRAGPRPHAGTVILAFVAFAAASFVARPWLHRHVARNYRIPSSAMAPTLEIGDWVFVVPLGSQPLRDGQVVTYVSEGNPLVKRIVALPGDTVEMRHGQLIRDGRAVAEPYVTVGDSLEYVDSAFAWQTAFLVDPAKRAAYHPTIDTWGPLAVPAGSVFLLGDDRHNSNDSRYAGFIPVGNIFGRPANIYMSWAADSSRIRWGRIGRPIR